MYKCVKPNGEIDENAWNKARDEYEQSARFRATGMGMPIEDKIKKLNAFCKMTGCDLLGNPLTEEQLANLDKPASVHGDKADSGEGGASSSSSPHKLRASTTIKKELSEDKALDPGSISSSLASGSAKSAAAIPTKKTIKTDEADDVDDDAPMAPHSKLKGPTKASTPTSSSSAKPSKVATSSRAAAPRLRPCSTAGSSCYVQGNYGGRRAVKLEDGEDDEDDKDEQQRPSTRRRLA